MTVSQAVPGVRMVLSARLRGLVGWEVPVEARLLLDTIRLLVRDIGGVLAWPAVALIVFFAIKEPLLERFGTLQQLDVLGKVKLQFSQRVAKRQQELSSAKPSLSPKELLEQAVPYLSGQAARYLFTVDGKTLTSAQHQEALAKCVGATGADNAAYDAAYMQGRLHELWLDVPGLVLFLEQPAGQDQYTIRLPAEVHTRLWERMPWWLQALDALGSQGSQASGS